MAESIPSLVAFVCVYGLIVFIHEFGHYSVGRLLVGIPRSDIRIVLLDFPQHVALRDGDDWVKPHEQPRYGEAYSEYNAERAQFQHIDLYIAGGLIGQTVGVAVIGGLCLVVGERLWAELFVELSILLSGSYFLFDIGSYLSSSRKRGYTGDFSALWMYSPAGIIMVISFFVLVHGSLYFLL
ncbi:hypothetical protein [Halostella salina]|uniref:hypothetical protein n=1 Tax=Halostella salina TaxID=1547897 RepID=UPI000EF75BAD|nr:hypothetical protein [Halostella salina]